MHTKSNEKRGKCRIRMLLTPGSFLLCNFVSSLCPCATISFGIGCLDMFLRNYKVDSRLMCVLKTSRQFSQSSISVMHVSSHLIRKFLIPSLVLLLLSTVEQLSYNLHICFVMFCIFNVMLDPIFNLLNS